MSKLRTTCCLAAGLLAAACSASSAENASAPANQAAAKGGADDPIQSAMSAAPASIAREATIVAMNADHSMRTLREGNNGFTCMPDNPATPGPDPMCMDANALRWASAWIGRQAPPTDNVGIMYMLRGGTDASNTDPYATAPEAGNQWVETGPHLMVVGSESVLRGYPTTADDTTRPYVMWAGTPYAHLMIPVG